MYNSLTEYEKGWFDRADRYNQQSKVYIMIADTEVKIGHGVTPKNRFNIVKKESKRDVQIEYKSFYEYKTISPAPLIEKLLLNHYKCVASRKKEYFLPVVSESFDMMVKYFDNKIISEQHESLPCIYNKTLHYQNKIYFYNGFIGTVAEIAQEFTTLGSNSLSKTLHVCGGDFEKAITIVNGRTPTTNYSPTVSCLAYDNFFHWRLDLPNDYKSAVCKGVLSQCKSHMTIKTISDYEADIIDRSRGYTNYKDFIKHNPIDHIFLKSYGRVKLCRRLFSEKAKSQIVPITKEDCIAVAKTCGSRSQFYSTYNKYYQVAKSLGCIDECIRQLPKYKTPNVCTLEEAKLEALKYGRRSDWQKSHGRTYQAAFKHGWLEVCCSHMRSNWRK